MLNSTVLKNFNDIQILKDEGDLVSTPIEIFGTRAARECAREKIEELAEDLSMKRMRETSENEKQQTTESRYFCYITLFAFRSDCQC